MGEPHSQISEPKVEICMSFVHKERTQHTAVSSKQVNAPLNNYVHLCLAQIRIDTSSVSYYNIQSKKF